VKKGRHREVFQCSEKKKGRVTFLGGWEGEKSTSYLALDKGDENILPTKKEGFWAKDRPYSLEKNKGAQRKNNRQKFLLLHQGGKRPGALYKKKRKTAGKRGRKISRRGNVEKAKKKKVSIEEKRAAEGDARKDIKWPPCLSTKREGGQVQKGGGGLVFGCVLWVVKGEKYSDFL